MRKFYYYQGIVCYLYCEIWIDKRVFIYDGRNVLHNLLINLSTLNNRECLKNIENLLEVYHHTKYLFIDETK